MLRLSLLLILALSAPLAAQRGLSVTGNGEASSETDMLIIRGVLEVAAPGAAESLAKHANLVKKARKALGEIEVGGIEIMLMGPTLAVRPKLDQNTAMMYGRQDEASDTAMVVISEAIEVRISGLSAFESTERLASIGTIIDVATEMELLGRKLTQAQMRRSYTISSSTGASAAKNLPLEFRGAKAEAVERKALENALKDARAKAEVLATLAGVKIGGILSISTNVGKSPWTRTALSSSCAIEAKVVFAIAE